MNSNNHIVIRRSRLHYAMLTAITIVAGFASCSELSEYWPPFVATYSGDVLWALMVFLGLGFLFPTLSTGTISAVVLLYSFGVEFGQLYHAAWIDSFRETFLGAVMIGRHFSWSALACYVVGCSVGAIAEGIGRMLDKRKKPGTERRVVPATRHDITMEEMS